MLPTSAQLCHDNELYAFASQAIVYIVVWSLCYDQRTKIWCYRGSLPLGGIKAHGSVWFLECPARKLCAPTRQGFDDLDDWFIVIVTGRRQVQCVKDTTLVYSHTDRRAVCALCERAFTYHSDILKNEHFWPQNFKMSNILIETLLLWDFQLAIFHADASIDVGSHGPPNICVRKWNITFGLVCPTSKMSCRRRWTDH